MVWTHTLNPVILNLGFLEIRWYGLMYVFAFLLLYFYVLKRIKNRRVDLTQEQLDSFLVYATIGMIIGSRLFEVLFYNSNYYLKNPLLVFAIWQGGLSFYGGLLGIVLGVVLFCKRFSKNFFHIANEVVVPLALGQSFGRLGNFINGELYGIKTNLPWAVNFGDGIPRHPTQVYEIIYNIIIFLTLYFLRDKKISKLGLFLVMYGIFRFATEFLREVVDPVFTGLTLSQWFCFLIIIIGIWLINKKNEFKS